jgi:MFS family permease
MDGQYAKTVATVTLWQVAASVCYYTVFAATPFFRATFGLDGFRVGLVVTTLTLGYAVFLFPFGAAVDAYGEKRLLVVGLVGLSAGTLAVTLARSYPTLLLATFLLGTMYGTAIPGTNKAIYNRITGGRVNFAVGVKQVGVTAGSAVSAVLVTGVGATRYGWQGGFVAAAGVGVLVAVLFTVSYPAGSGSGELSLPDIGDLVAFRPYRLLAIAGLFLGACLFTTVGYTVLYVHERVGASIAFAGVVLAGVQVAGSVGRVVSGWLGDVLPGSPQRRTAGILLVQAVGGTVVLAAVPLIDSTVGVVLAFLLLGLFVLGFTGMYYSTMGTFVSTAEMGSATAGGQLALTAGALVAPPAFGYLVDVAGYRAAWLFLAVLGGGGAAVVALVFVAEPSPRRAVEESP